MKSEKRFAVYEFVLVIGDGQMITRPLIVIKEGKEVVMWTDLHKYLGSGKNTMVIEIKSTAIERARIVCKLLNYVTFEKYHIESLADITIGMVKDFLNHYGMCTLPGDVPEDDKLNGRITYRSRKTVERAVAYIIDFLDNMIKQEKGCKLKKSQLYEKVEILSKKKRDYITIKKPVFKVHYKENPEKILRNLPESVFVILMNQIVEKHTNILMLAALSAFAGLRPSEACNVRRPDSRLGPGLRFEMIDGEIYNVVIDLNHEYDLRSDHIRVGGIKIGRDARVYPAFLEAFGDCYRLYMSHIEGRRYESEYGALTVNRDGKAMTYKSYYLEFRQVVKECIPQMLEDDDPEVRNYGLLLQEHNISPHIFRHWFSVKLTLFGETVSGLMFYRGDTSPESALTIINNKSDLDKELEIVSDRDFDFNMWRALKEFVQD